VSPNSEANDSQKLDTADIAVPQVFSLLQYPPRKDLTYFQEMDVKVKLV
jgi:hypothetical protein